MHNCLYVLSMCEMSGDERQKCCQNPSFEYALPHNSVIHYLRNWDQIWAWAKKFSPGKSCQIISTNEWANVVSSFVTISGLS